jgi:hypothetical protein
MMCLHATTRSQLEASPVDKKAKVPKKPKSAKAKGTAKTA